MSPSAIPKALRDRVLERDGGRCQYCRLSQVGQGGVFHIDHIIPKSKGGGTEEGNLALQCPYCSLHKSDKVTASDPLAGELAVLFHPLRQSWAEHFSLDLNGVCRGISPIGRATVAALSMNDLLPRLARSLQIRLGLLTPSNA